MNKQQWKTFAGTFFFMGILFIALFKLTYMGISPTIDQIQSLKGTLFFIMSLISFMLSLTFFTVSFQEK